MTNQSHYSWLLKFLASSLVAALVVFWWLLDNSQVMKSEARERFFEQYNTQQLLLAQQASKNIEEFFATLRRNLGIVASLFETGPVTTERGNEVGDSLDRIYGLISDMPIIDLVVFDDTGIVVAISPHDPYTLGRDYSWRGYFQWAKAQPGRTGRMYLSPITRLAGGQNRGDNALIVAQGIYTSRGVFKGVAMFTLNFDTLMKIYVQNLRIGKEGYAWLVDSSNQTVLVDSNGRVGGQGFNEAFAKKWPKLHEMLLATASGEPGMDWYEFEDPADPSNSSKSVRKLVGYAPVKIEDRLWSLGVCTPEREVEAMLSSYFHRTTTFSTTALIAVFTGAVMMVGLLLGWNRALRGAARERTHELEMTHSKLKETFGELLSARKIAAVGNMALGLVHEVRNPLSAIRMNVQMLRKRMTGDGGTTEHFSIVEGEISRLNRLLGDVMFYARPATLDRSEVDLSQVIEQVVLLTGERLQDAQIDVAVASATDIPKISCDPEQIHQVLLNLIINAIDALEETPQPKTIRVALSRNDHMALLAVSDNGPGIGEELSDKIFEPFYTAKSKGLGLGLSIVDGIVTRHGGKVSVKTSDVGGATFVVSLPLKPIGKNR